MAGKYTYFISDTHLGAAYLSNPRESERRVVRWLQSIKDSAERIYLLGDIIDYWFEYRNVVPRGFVRFFGKLAELADAGIAITWITGNHDIWMYGYLEQECGVVLHRAPVTVEIYNKVFMLAHGDGLGDPDRQFRFLRSVFHNKVCQRLFSMLHPRFSMKFGMSWAKHSRMKRVKMQQALCHGAEGTQFNGNVVATLNSSGEPEYMGEEREHLVVYAKEYMMTHPDVDYYIFGHRHIELDLTLGHRSRMIILGDWIWQFTYAVFDGEHLFLEQYVEGESKP